MSIVDYFNPFNIDHIRAHVHLMKTGSWPASFLHGNTQVIFDAGWQIGIMNKLANVWVDYMIDPSSVSGT